VATDLAVAERRLIVALVVAVAAAAAPPVAATPRTTVFNDIVVNERIDGDVVAFEADVLLGPNADVEGDVVVVSGHLRLDPNARVGRHVLTIFGTLDAAPEARVGGRVLAFSSLSNVLLRPGQRTPLHVDLAVRLLTSGGWLLITTGLAFVWPTRLRYGVWVLPRLGLEVAVLGLAAAITFFAAVVAVLGLGPTVGVPLAAALTLGFFALRAIGLTVAGGLLGAAVLRRVGARAMPLTLEVFLGVVVLLVIRFLPWLGGLVWSAVAIVALGTGIMALATGGENGRAVTTVS
jgi:hypothetical protein